MQGGGVEGRLRGLGAAAGAGVLPLTTGLGPWVPEGEVAAAARVCVVETGFFRVPTRRLQEDLARFPRTPRKASGARPGYGETVPVEG